MADETPTPKPTHKPVVRVAANQPSYAVGTDTFTLVMTGKDTNGGLFFSDGIIPPGGGPPPHCHSYQEMLFVLDGELTVFCEGTRSSLTRNDAANIPGWAPHMLKNFSSAPVRVVCAAWPPGLEDQFVETGTQVPHRNSLPPALTAAEQERMAKAMLASSERHNARMLPPDMFDQLLDLNEREVRPQRVA